MTAAGDELLIGLVSISDRASSGVYKDEGIPALEEKRFYDTLVQVPLDDR